MGAGREPLQGQPSQLALFMLGDLLAKRRQKVTAKTKLKRELGRSPDRYDALALACYEPQYTDEPVPERDERSIHDMAPGREFDPRAGLRAFR